MYAFANAKFTPFTEKLFVFVGRLVFFVKLFSMFYYIISGVYGEVQICIWAS